MRFFHVTPKLEYGAPDCQCIFDVHNIFMDMQFSSEIYSQEIDSHLGSCAAYPYKQIEHNITSDDVIIYYHQNHAATGEILNFLQGQKDFVHMWVVLYLLTDQISDELLLHQEMFSCCLLDKQNLFQHNGRITCPVYYIPSNERRNRLPTIQSYLYANNYPSAKYDISVIDKSQTKSPATKDLEQPKLPNDVISHTIEVAATESDVHISLRSKIRNWLSHYLPASIMKNMFPARELAELEKCISMQRIELEDRISMQRIELEKRIDNGMTQVRHDFDIKIEDSCNNLLFRLEKKIDELARQLNANVPYALPPVNIYDYHHHPNNVEKNIFVDVTGITQVDLGTGIQRVVNNLYMNLVDKRHVIPFRDGAAFGQKRFNFVTPSYSMQTSYAYVDRFQHMNIAQIDKTLGHSMDNAIIFLLDSSWEHASHLTYLLSYALEHNSHVYALVHDLIPFQYPQLLDSDKLRQVFTEWHNMILEKADGIICVSKTTADAVAEYYESMKFVRRTPLKLFYFHPGADIPALVPQARASVKDFVAAKTTFLMVGTVEPRKGYKMVLEAFQEIVMENDVQLLILGHDGWHNDEIKKLLKDNVDLQSHVLWVQDAEDAELQWAYNNTEALIAASIAEGFGLPLIEATHFNLPVICSDIPIFHEVLQDHAVFFQTMNKASFINCIKKWLTGDKPQPHERIYFSTWAEAGSEVCNILEQKITPYKIMV